MVKKNNNFNALQGSYLFVEIANRKKKFIDQNPQCNVISLGIGDTTQALPPHIINGMRKKVEELSVEETYTGYPDYNGSLKLRRLISSVIYNGVIGEEEIYVSDGSKPDLARLQFLFAADTKFAVQDPVYPAYVDGLVISGRGGEYIESKGRYSNINYINCVPENSFFPNLNEIDPNVNCIYFCSPNNPTGEAASREQLTKLVNFAIKNNKIIIFDSAYRDFITDPSIPRSIYEIEGAKHVAFETCSLSKTAGFTGVRLGWTVCPKQLKFSDGTQVCNDWSRIVGTFFNGPSNVSEAGAIAALSPEGQREVEKLVKYYLENAKIVKEALKKVSKFEVYGGVNSPYLWIKMRGENKSSWIIFQELLENTHLVTTPGIGFGCNGEGFIRISTFANRKNVEEASKRIINYFTK